MKSNQIHGICCHAAEVVGERHMLWQSTPTPEQRHVEVATLE
jgi:hypothetical protein